MPLNFQALKNFYINKADICPTDSIEVVIAYKINKNLKEFPLRLNETPSVQTEKMLGWGNINYGVKNKQKVSPELKLYLNYIKINFLILMLK